MGKNYQNKFRICQAWHFDWEDGEDIPDIPGVKFREWYPVELASGLVKDAPDTGTAYVTNEDQDDLVGCVEFVDVDRGDWIIRFPGFEDTLVLGDDVFKLLFEPVPEPKTEDQDLSEASIG